MLEKFMRILIVEDDRSLATGLTSILQKEGWGVSVALDGAGALRAVASESFDLLILDIGLPEIDGFDVIRRMRDKGESVPILVLSARDEPKDRVRGLDLGADDYLAKPFATSELAARVRALIRRSQGRTGQKLIHGPLTIDAEAVRGFLGGQPLTLRPREWAVLRVLLDRTGKIVSKEAILEAIAGW